MCEFIVWTYKYLSMIAEVHMDVVISTDLGGTTITRSKNKTQYLITE